MQAFDSVEHPELIEDPLTIDMDLDNLVNQGFEGNPQRLSDASWASTTGCAIRKNVTFDFQPTNPQTDIMPTWKCDIIIRSVDLMKCLHPDACDEAAMLAKIPEVTTSECACIYSTNGKCVGMLTIDRLKILEAYEASKKAGFHDTIQPPVQQLKLWACSPAKRPNRKIFLHRAKGFLIQTCFLLLPAFDQPCKNGAWSQQRGIPAPLTLKTHTITTSVQIAETKSLEHTQTPSQCAISASPFAIHLMMMK